MGTLNVLPFICWNSNTLNQPVTIQGIEAMSMIQKGQANTRYVADKINKFLQQNPR